MGPTSCVLSVPHLEVRNQAVASPQQNHTLYGQQSIDLKCSQPTTVRVLRETRGERKKHKK